MKLAALAKELNGTLLGDAGSLSVTSVVYDSRRATTGSVFVAVPGISVDGHSYLSQAISSGVTAVTVQADHSAVWEPTLSAAHVPAIVVLDTKSALAQAAAAVTGYPALSLGVIGITGTDGKTSLSSLVDHILWSAGARSGLITTAECRIGDTALLDTGRFTTPESPEIQAMLKAMVESECQWAVLEATSHGLVQHRLDCCEFDIAAVTTIGSDHLDFHGSREDYIRAKLRLFQMLDTSVEKGIAKTAVLNADDPEFGRLRGSVRGRVVSYGINKRADLWLSGRDVRGWKTAFTLHTPGGSIEAEVLGPAIFSVQNALAATGVCLSAGLDLDVIADGMATWNGAPGRMELVDEGQPFSVVVDFAHSADALQRVLEVLREHRRGRLIAVFGCIGERERDRRFGMGEVSAQHADFTIVTDDNPYTENRDQILGEIVRGLVAAGKRPGHDFTVIPDRREAIAHALAMAVDDDTVLLAGKGHETQVHLPDGVYDCDDRAVARATLFELVGRSSPE